MIEEVLSELKPDKSSMTLSRRIRKVIVRMKKLLCRVELPLIKFYWLWRSGLMIWKKKMEASQAKWEESPWQNNRRPSISRS